MGLLEGMARPGRLGQTRSRALRWCSLRSSGRGPSLLPGLCARNRSIFGSDARRGGRNDDHAAQAHPDQSGLARGLVAVVGQARTHRAILALPVAIVGAPVVLVELALLVGRQLVLGVDVRRVL